MYKRASTVLNLEVFRRTCLACGMIFENVGLFRDQKRHPYSLIGKFLYCYVNYRHQLFLLICVNEGVSVRVCFRSNLSFYHFLRIYIYICVCVCVCVCANMLKYICLSLHMRLHMCLFFAIRFRNKSTYITRIEIQS